MRSYLITITPPNEICSFVEVYRQKYAKYTGYYIPPHITLHQSFYLKGISEDDVVKIIRNAVEGQNSLNICINKIAFFSGNNNVLYFKPDSTSQKFIKDLFLKLLLALSGKIKNRYLDFIVTRENFSAHMTIAEKIPDDIFESLKKETEKFNEPILFIVSAVDIYAQDPDSKKYELLRSISF